MRQNLIQKSCLSVFFEIYEYPFESYIGSFSEIGPRQDLENNLSYRDRCFTRYFSNLIWPS